MGLSVQKFREIVFQLLYSRSFQEGEGAIPLVMRLNAIPKKTTIEANEKVDMIWDLHKDLDLMIAQYCQEFSFERISHVEKAVLRLGVFELFHTDLKGSIVISEAIRLARKYSTKEGGKFINALLDAIYKEGEHQTLSTRQAAL